MHIMYKQIIKKHSANIDALPQDYLIIAQQKFALNSADAIETSYFSERLEILLQTPNNRSLFKIVFWVSV